MSDKDNSIQSIIEESRRTNTKLRCAEEKIKRLVARLLDRLVPETKLLDGQVVIRDRHERRQSQDALRDTPPLDCDLQPRYRRPTTTSPHDTGQPRLPPEQIRNAGTLPIHSVINRDPSLRPAKWPPDLSSQDQKEPSPHMRACLLQIAAHFDEESEVYKEQRASPEELIRLMRQVPVPVKPQGTRDVKANERESLRDEVVRLKEQLVAAKEKQRIAEEEAHDVCRELDQSKVALRGAEEEGHGVRRELY